MLNILSYRAFDTVNAARWLVIAIMIALLFSPPITTIAEVCLLACFVASAELRRRLVRTLRQPMVISVLILYLLFGVGTLYSIGSWNQSLEMWFSWRKLLLLPIAATLFDEDIWKQRLAWSLILVATGCAVVSYVSLFASLEIYKYPSGIVIRNHATQGIIFSVAAFASAVLLTFGHAIGARQRNYLLFSLLLFVVNVVYVTPGRSGYLLLLVLGMVFAFYFSREHNTKGVMFLIPLLAAVLLVSSPTARERISDGFLEIANYREATSLTPMGVRAVMWNNSIALIHERPWFGFGTGSFEEAYRQQVAGQTGWQGEVTNDPHNQFMKIAVEHGLLGLAAFVAFIATFFAQPCSFPYRILGVGVLLAWCATSLFSSHFSTFSEGRFLALWCGAMFAFSQSAVSSLGRSRESLGTIEPIRPAAPDTRPLKHDKKALSIDFEGWFGRLR